MVVMENEDSDLAFGLYSLSTPTFTPCVSTVESRLSVRTVAVQSPSHV